MKDSIETSTNTDAGEEQLDLFGGQPLPLRETEPVNAAVAGNPMAVAVSEALS